MIAPIQAPVLMEKIPLVLLQGLSRATDISSSDAEIRKNGIKLLSGAIKAIFSFNQLATTCIDILCLPGSRCIAGTA